MQLRFVNDPTFDGLPAVGSGEPGLLAARTQCGLAVVWDPGSGDPKALAAFLGGDLVEVEGLVYERQGNGSLSPVLWTKQRCVIVRPPAGPVQVLDALTLKSGWAQVVDAAEPVADETGDVDGDGQVDGYESQTVAQLVDVLRGRGLPTSGKRAELIAALREDDKVRALVAPPEGEPAGDAAPTS